VTLKKADSFIFGERYKSYVPRFFFLCKKFVYTTYYPDLKYIEFRKPKLEEGQITLCFTGKLSIEKGFGNFINAVNKLADARNSLKITLKIIGWYSTEKDRTECKMWLSRLSPDVTMKFIDKQEFLHFSSSISDVDLFFDLRKTDIENHLCLPIKLFYYAAQGRPVIYSDLRSIHSDIAINEFGFLVNPQDTNRIVKIIEWYIDNPEQYYIHCSNARRLAETEYNWSKIEGNFINFIESHVRNLNA
jgi:glycosyltransferase involved in cell wall biosynthesis